MSKQDPITWKPSDTKRLKKAVDNFNAKRRRLIKKDPSLKKVLPEKVTLKEMKELIHTRDDLRNELKSLRAFTDYKRGKTKKGKPKAQPHDLIVVRKESFPGANDSLVLTRWQVNEMKRSAKYINKERKVLYDQMQNIEMHSRGQGLGYKYSETQMGEAMLNQFLPTEAFTAKMDVYNARKKYKALRKERQMNYWDEKQMLMKENYIRALEENYNPEDMKDVIEHIQSLSFSEFYETFKHEPDMFEYASFKANQEQYEEYVTSIKSTWLPNKKSEDLPQAKVLNTKQTQQTSQNVSKADPNSNKTKPQTTRKNKS